ncbi:MAG: flagellar motor switch protein FliN [Spirochaetia bacterium]|nr:flagellar motor switch protein FliN [Spirochaetia bacterium]
MGEGSLSQEEIDALLMGADEPIEETGISLQNGSTISTGETMSEQGKVLLIGAFNDAMQTASSSAGTLIGKDFNISQASIEEINATSVSDEIEIGSIIAVIRMGSATSTLVFPTEQAKKIASLMMGAEAELAEMDEAHLSTIGELANTIISSLSNKLTDKFGESLSPGPADAIVYSGSAELPPFQGNLTAKITYNLKLEGHPDSRLIHFLDGEPAARWANNLAKTAGVAMESSGQAQQPQKQQQQQTQQAGFFVPQPRQSNQPGQQNVPISPVSFPSLQAVGESAQHAPVNIDLLLDIQMGMTVELGRTRKFVKEILSLGEGSIIELDKLAGEPVDLLINKKLIAKGEVVVIDENFGVRVTDIIGPAERLAKLTAK